MAVSSNNLFDKWFPRIVVGFLAANALVQVLGIGHLVSGWLAFAAFSPDGVSETAMPSEANLERESARQETETRAASPPVRAANQLNVELTRGARAVTLELTVR